jgi:hypothetical protein
MSRTKNGVHRLKGGRRNIGKGDAPYLSFYCRGTVEAPHKKWLIGSVCPSERPEDASWHESSSGYAETGSDVLVKVFPPFTKWLDGDTFIPREGHDPSVFSSPTFRVVWDLECPQCKYSRRIGTPKTAYSVIDDLVILGIEEIPVREFVARLDRHRVETRS